jgi:hypothetical protein
MRILSLRSTVRGIGALAIVTALALAVLPGSASAHQSNVHQAAKKPTISTYKSWQGGQAVEPFGCPDTSTYGQVITVPSGMTHLQKFKFYMNDNGLTGSMVVRAEVYAWDGTKASGDGVFESKPRTLNFANGLFDKVTFNAFGAHVVSGSQYVLFVSIDKDYEQCLNNYQTSWGATDDSAYPGGSFVFQNNAGDESQWTETPWSVLSFDLVFKAYLS